MKYLYDDTHVRVRKISDQLSESFKKSLMSGCLATHAHPGYYPRELKMMHIEPRLSGRNKLIGTTVSYPQTLKVAVGITYFDAKDMDDNEDIHLFDFTVNELWSYKGKSFETDDPRYKGYHRGAKDYLRK